VQDPILVVLAPAVEEMGGVVHICLYAGNDRHTGIIAYWLEVSDETNAWPEVSQNLQSDLESSTRKPWNGTLKKIHMHSAWIPWPPDVLMVILSRIRRHSRSLMANATSTILFLSPVRSQ